VGGACVANLGEMAAYKLLVRKSEGNRPLRRPRHRWVDNIKMDFVEIRRGGVISDDVLALDKDNWRARVNAVMILRAP
jgi:hypothetical protein